MRQSHVRFIRQQGFPESSFDDGLYSALMFQPRLIGAVVVTGAVFHNPWVFLVLSGVLAWSTIVPTRNPIDAFYNRVVAYPRGRTPIPTAPGPRRTSQGMAATVAFAIASALFLGATFTAGVLEGFFGSVVAIVIFGNVCPGSPMYQLLCRVRRRISTPTGIGCETRESLR